MRAEAASHLREAAAAAPRRHSNFVLLAVAVVASLPFWRGMSAQPLADDWPLLERASHLTLSEVPSLVTATEAGWYRPLPTLLLALLWPRAGANALPYHAAVFLMYLAVGVLVGRVATTATHTTVGVLATLLFATHAGHTESVYWLAAGNEVMAGFFAIVAIVCVFEYRKGTTEAWAGVALGSAVLALASKETAATIPLLMAVMLLLPTAHARPKRVTTWAALYTLVTIAYGVLRVSAGAPYDTKLSHIPVHAAYYTAVIGLALPQNYGYASSLALWRATPLVPIGAVALAGAGLGLVGIAARSAQPCGGYRALVTMGLMWLSVTAVPALLTATGRTGFLLSIGFAWSLAALAGCALAGENRAKVVGALGVALWVGGNSGVIYYRGTQWHEAGEAMAATLQQVQTSPESLCVVQLPDNIEHAYVFRNAEPSLSRLLWPARPLTLVTDEECAALGACARACPPGASIVQTP